MCGIFSETANKANAAKFLLKRDGIDIKDAVSFGDGENDHEMLTMAEKGFIMGNALYRLKDMLPEDFEMVGTNNEIFLNICLLLFFISNINYIL